MKRPLTTVALFYAGGLLLGDNFHLPSLWLFAAAFTAFFAGIFSGKNVFLWTLVVLIGWLNITWQTAVVSPIDLRTQMGTEPEYLTLRGTLRQTPNFRVFEFDEAESWRTLAQIDVTAIRRGEKWLPAAGLVQTSTSGVLGEEFCSGQKIEVTGILQTPRAPMAEGLFDYQTYLKRHGIYFQLRVDSTNEWRTIGSLKGSPVSDRFFSWAQAVLQKGLPMEDEPLRLVWAMTLGWKTALTDEVSEPFMKSGTMHIFAISGLHIALIAGILVALFRVLQIPRGWCGLFVIPLIWFYTMSTGWQPSAIRSTIMMTLIIGGWSLKRPTDLLNSLAASAFIILIWDPQQLFQASFQLSFFVVLSIALLMPALQKYRDRWLDPDPMLPPELRASWRQRLDFPLRIFTTSAATSLAAWLGSLPLIAYYFHLFTPISLPANLVIVPLASGALAANLGSLICGNWFPGATELFNHAGWFLMKTMVLLSHWFAARSSGAFYVPAPSIFACSIYYSLLFTVLNGWLFAPRKKLVVFALMTVALAFGLWSWRVESRSVKITVLPLSGGDAVFADFPGRGNDLLIDCGNKNTAEFILKPFLRGQGVNEIKNLLLTHGDLRHIGGIELIRSNFVVGKIITSTVPHRSPEYRKIISDMQPNPENWKQISTGDQLGAWSVLHPQSSDTFPQADDKAVGLRGTIFGKTILLLSDLGRPGQNALLERDQNLRADIVVCGLPSQREPLHDALLEKIQPEIIVITDSEFPATERAPAQLRGRLEKQKARVIYGRRSGAITMEFEENHFRIRSASEE